MRELGSNADFVWVEFLVLYDQNNIREFGYVRREDGKDIADGVYQVRMTWENAAGFGASAMENGKSGGARDGADECSLPWPSIGVMGIFHQLRLIMSPFNAILLPLWSPTKRSRLPSISANEA